MASYEAILAAEESPWKEVVAPITGMRAEGERLLSVDTEEGYAALYALTFPVVSSQEGNTYPAGTGPYRVSAYSEGDSLDLERWESWWRTPAQIPAIHATALENDASVLNTFQAGLLDVCAVDMLTVSSVTERSTTSSPIPTRTTAWPWTCPSSRTAGWPSGSWAWNTTPSARGSS